MRPFLFQSGIVVRGRNDAYHSQKVNSAQTVGQLGGLVHSRQLIAAPRVTGGSMKRRILMRTGVIGPLAVAGGTVFAQMSGSSGKTYVLVSGTWCGGCPNIE
jgi:hypothetical protein